IFNRFALSSLFPALLVLLTGCAHKIKLPGDAADLSGGSLSLIHFNDGSSRLLNAGVGMEDYGGVARFATVVAKLKRKSAAAKSPLEALITVSAGNDFRAGQIFNVSLRKGIPFYDATALDIIGVDAILIADHAFDMGPDVFAKYIAGFSRTHPVFLSANLNFNGEPSLRLLSKDGTILPSTIIERGGFKFGLIGITPTDIAETSSPRRVTVNDDLAAEVQTRVNDFLEIGVKRIIVIANFDSLKKTRSFIRRISGIDLLVLGAASAWKKPCLSGYLSRSSQRFPSYPIYALDSIGRNVVLVGTPGEYCFAGRIKVYFDSDGEVATLDPSSGISKVVGDGAPNSVAPDPVVNRSVVIPLARALSTTSRSLGVSNVPLDGALNHISTRETNLGDFAADAVLWRSTALSKSYGVSLPTVVLLKSNLFKSGLPKGNISDADVFAAFSSCDSLSILEGASPADLKLLLEGMLASSGVSESGNGAFPQVAGMRFVFNPTRASGSRVKSIRLDTGDAIVLNYKVLPFAPKVNFATVGSPALEKWGIDWKSKRICNLGELPQNAVIAYLSGSAKSGALNGVISSDKYPITGLRRIMITRE
ncbi:MAG: hypothetical protein GXP32_07585, partial [Kiritimatiellaeota bacterium]|nr:hypothetical protein [Kiritimatiellota bacterium]